MKNLTAALKRISGIVKKEADIINGNGYVVYSSSAEAEGSILRDSDSDRMPLDSRERLYIRIENGSREELGLARLILKDRISEGTADNYQQFLINILDGIQDDINECEKFGLPLDGSYIIYSVSLMSAEYLSDAYSLISNSFCGDGDAWVFPYGDDVILLVRADGFSESVRSNARVIKDMIISEMLADITVGVGDIHDGIAGIKRSYDEAKEAVRVGGAFNLAERIFVYRDMLPERMVDLIPEDRVEELCRGIFNDGTLDVFDGEMNRTVEVFFNNNLNISDSSRILYIHRNTLIYRLDKIQKATGLDLRKFEDAVRFKLIYLLKQRRRI